jgi:hypothetical protein
MCTVLSENQPIQRQSKPSIVFCCKKLLIFVFSSTQTNNYDFRKVEGNVNISNHNSKRGFGKYLQVFSLAVCYKFYFSCRKAHPPMLMRWCRKSKR